MSDPEVMRDATYVAKGIVEKYGWKEGYRQARKCLADAETRFSQGYWLRVCLVLEQLHPEQPEPRDE